jgi:hypothetical protein
VAAPTSRVLVCMAMPLERVIVAFETLHEQRTSYSVVVWNGRDKAVALAASQHISSRPKDEIFRVFVEELGPPQRNPDDTPVMGGHELVDRYEW